MRETHWKKSIIHPDETTTEEVIQYIQLIKTMECADWAYDTAIQLIEQFLRKQALYPPTIKDIKYQQYNWFLVSIRTN